MREITAAEMARAARVDPKRFRMALRGQSFPWHRHGEPWTVICGSTQHQQLQAILDSLASDQTTGGGSVEPRFGCEARGHRPAGVRRTSDEHYIIDLCDDALSERAHRGHRFDFLRGDPDRGGTSRALPVDAYYPALKLVIEYCERQHTEQVAFFDRRETISGVPRGVQRARYDQRRREILPRHGIHLIELNYSDFPHDARKRLLRTKDDRPIVARCLGERGATVPIK